MKTRQAFYLHTTKLTRIARRLCREILRPWHAARHPYMPINSAAIKAECEYSPPSMGGRRPWSMEGWRGPNESSCPCAPLVHAQPLTPHGPPQARPGCLKLPRAHWC